MLVPLNFFIPLVGKLPYIWVENYFNLGGTVAVVVDSAQNQVKLEQKELVGKEKVVHVVLNILKVLSYLLILPPLVLLIAKGAIRLANNFQIAKEETPEGEPAAALPLTCQADSIEVPSEAVFTPPACTKEDPKKQPLLTPPTPLLPPPVNLQKLLADPFRPTKTVYYFSLNNSLSEFDLDGTEDPISNEPIKNFTKADGSLAIVVTSNGVIHAVSSIATWLSNLPAGRFLNDEPLWKTKEEYIALLTYLIDQTEGELRENMLLQKTIFESHIRVIERLELDLGFVGILRSLSKLFESTASVGANFLCVSQKFAIDKYYEIRDALPPGSEKVFFPGHIFDPGDQFCVAAAQKRFLQQIDRLSILVTENTALSCSQEELDLKLQSLLIQLRNAFPVTPQPRTTRKSAFSEKSIIDHAIEQKEVSFLCVVDQNEVKFTQSIDLMYPDKNIVGYYLFELLMQPEDFDHKDSLLTLKEEHLGGISGFTSALEKFFNQLIEQKKDILQKEFWGIYTKKIYQWMVFNYKDKLFPFITQLKQDHPNLLEKFVAAPQRGAASRAIVEIIKKDKGESYALEQFKKKDPSRWGVEEIAFLHCILGLQPQDHLRVTTDKKGIFWILGYVKEISSLGHFIETTPDGQIKLGIFKRN